MPFSLIKLINYNISARLTNIARAKHKSRNGIEFKFEIFIQLKLKKKYFSYIILVKNVIILYSYS